MSSVNRVKQIEKKLNLKTQEEPMEYMLLLTVRKDKSFEESQAIEDGFNEVWVNGWINVHQGKRFLGQYRYQDKPHVMNKIKEIYAQTQNDIKNNPNAGMAIVWVFLKEKENGEVVLKGKRS